MTSYGERYEILAELGSGGMAAVFRARDRSLNRDVALKILHAEAAQSPAIVARMFREARVIASLDHPGVLKLYDVVEALPSPYLVMELLHGETLQEKLKDRAWPLRSRITVLEQVARAVDHAHQHGVVHRDLKPSNVMIEEATSNKQPATSSGSKTQDQGLGIPRVVVMDFGLAHIANSQSRLTRSGASMGTPYYMAPEQVRGEKGLIKPATDVWALGVMLYEALAGRPPYTAGTTLEVYDAILRSEPGPLPNVPRDLAVVCFKALEKDPLRRYPSARAFADDLARHLAGESVAARPPSTLSRLAGRLARRRGAVIIGAAALLLMTLAVFLSALLGTRRSRSSSVQEAFLQEMRATSETCLAAALELRRAGNLDAMRKHAERGEEVCRRVISEMPSLAEPHFLLGRLLRVRMRFDEAMAALDRAVERDPGLTPARHERGLLRIRKYESRLEELRERWKRRQGELVQGTRGLAEVKPPARHKLEDEEARAWRLKATEDLESSVEAVARALLSWLAELDSEAARQFAAAAGESPASVEPYEWLGRLDQEAKEYAKAEQWYTRGIDKDRGYAPYFEQRSFVRIELGEAAVRLGQDPADHFLKADADAGEAVRLTPDRFEAWMARARVRLFRGVATAGGGGDPRELYAGSVEDCRRAGALQPGNDYIRRRRGSAHLNLASWLDARGMDPVPTCFEAIEDFEEAVRIAPLEDENWTCRGAAYMNLAHHYQLKGQDPAELTGKALASADEAIRLNPASEEHWMLRAAIRINRIAFGGRGDADRREAQRQAIADCDEALRLKPDYVQALKFRATALHNLASERMDRGEDPEEPLRRGLADVNEALRLTAGDGNLWEHRGMLRMVRIRILVKASQDFMPEVDAAYADFDQALRLNPADPDVLWRKGELMSSVAGYVQQRGGDPVPHLQQAIVFLGEAVKLNPALARAWEERGTGRAKLSALVKDQGGDPVELWREAIADLKEAVRLNPSLTSAWRWLGWVRLSWARRKSNAGEDPYALYRESLAAYDRAMNLAPGDANARRDRADAVQSLMIHIHERDPSEAGQLPALHRQCAEDYTRLMKEAPQEAQPVWRRGQSYFVIGRYEEALADFERAVSMQSDLGAQLRPVMTECRKRLDAR